MLTRKQGYAIGASLAVIAVYTYFWSYSAEKIEQMVVHQTAALKEKNIHISYDAINVSGYPFFINLAFKNLSLTTVQNQPYALQLTVDGDVVFSKFAFSTTQALSYKSTGNLNVQNPFIAALSGNHKGFEAQSVEGVINFKDPLDHVVLNFRNWSVLGYTGDNFDIVSRYDSDQKKSALTVYLSDIDPGRKLLEGMPSRIVEIGFDAEITNTIPFQGSVQETLDAWQRGDGVLDVSRMVVNWGPIDAVGNGTLILNDQDFPIVAISFDIVGLEKFIDILVANQKIKQNAALLAKAALSLMKEDIPSKDGRTIYHKISLTLQDGELMLGPVKIANFRSQSPVSIN